MNRIIGILLILCFSSTILLAQKPCRPSKHAKLPAITSLTYHKARTRLIAAGWQPFQTIHHNEGTDNPDIKYGNGEVFWNKGYWEVENCAGTGLAPCTFLFEDAYGNRLRVVTQGEELKRPRTYARVSSYRFVCD